jgi:hypothetical protein
LEAVIVREAMFGKIIEGHNSRHAGWPYRPPLLLFELVTSRAGHVERYQLQSYRFKPFFVPL